MAVIGTLGVFEVEHVGQALFGIVFRADVLFLGRTIGTRALARIVYPTHQVIVVCFFALARQVGGECPALHLIAFADGVAAQTAARFEQFFAAAGISGSVRHRRVG